eukprot:scaffold4145_cov115-Isochrysis_galbana.AAC.31
MLGEGAGAGEGAHARRRRAPRSLRHAPSPESRERMRGRAKHKAERRAVGVGAGGTPPVRSVPLAAARSPHAQRRSRQRLKWRKMRARTCRRRGGAEDAPVAPSGGRLAGMPLG